MNTQDFLPTLFAGSALAIQTLLVLNFAARHWAPRQERRWGWIIYALGLPALGLSALFSLARQPWYHGLAYLLFAAWAAFGCVVDILRPVNWRTPPRWAIFGPYVALYLAAQFAFWIPLWNVGPGYWAAYTALYAVSTLLNISSHARPRQTVGVGRQVRS